MSSAISASWRWVGSIGPALGSEDDNDGSGCVGLVLLRTWLGEIGLLRLTGGDGRRAAAAGRGGGRLGDGEDDEGPEMLALLKRGEEVGRD